MRAYALTVLALAAILLGLAPLALIWALNTLSPALAIPYSPRTWLAALLLLSLARGHVRATSER